MGLFGSMGGVNSALLGWAPKYGTSEMEVPEYQPVKVNDVLNKTVGANQSNWSGIADLTHKANKLGGEELLASMERISPGITQMMAQAQNTTRAMLAGNLPPDVQNAVIGAAAAKGVEGGFAKSSFGSALTARDLGLTSLDLITKGLSAGERWTVLVNQMTPQFNYASMMISPAQALQTEEFNTANQWNRDWLKKQVESLGSRTDQALNNMAIQFGNTADQAMSMYMGGGFGGAMGGGGGDSWAGSQTGQKVPVSDWGAFDRAMLG